MGSLSQTPPCLVITKPAEQAARWRTAFTDAGWQTRSLPLLALENLPETPEHRTAWLNLDQYAGVLMVSPHAALRCAQALDNYWPQPPTGVAWLCNGSGTARALRDHYPMAEALALHYPTSGNQAEDVLALPPMHQVAGERWLLVTGEGGRTLTADTLNARGARVTRLAVYRRRAIELSAEDLQSLAAPGIIIQISSLLALESLTSQAPLVTKQGVRLLVSSPRLATAAREFAWPHVTQADGASLEATLDALARHANHPAK